MKKGFLFLGPLFFFLLFAIGGTYAYLQFTEPQKETAQDAGKLALEVGQKTLTLVSDALDQSENFGKPPCQTDQWCKQFGNNATCQLETGECIEKK